MNVNNKLRSILKGKCQLHITHEGVYKSVNILYVLQQNNIALSFLQSTSIRCFNISSALSPIRIFKLDTCDSIKNQHFWHVTSFWTNLFWIVLFWLDVWSFVLLLALFIVTSIVIKDFLNWCLSNTWFSYFNNGNCL